MGEKPDSFRMWTWGRIKMLIFRGEWKIKSRRVNDGKSRVKKAFFIGGDALAVAIDSESAFLRSFLLPLISSFYSFSASALHSLRKPAFTLKPVHSPCLSSSTSFPFLTAWLSSLLNVLLSGIHLYNHLFTIEFSDKILLRFADTVKLTLFFFQIIHHCSIYFLYSSVYFFVVSYSSLLLSSFPLPRFFSVFFLFLYWHAVIKIKVTKIAYKIQRIINVDKIKET